MTFPTILLAVALSPATFGPSTAPMPPPRPAELARPAETLPQSAPLPPERPKELLSYAPQPRAPEAVPLPLPPEDTAACDGLLASGRIVATRVPPVLGEGGCGIGAPVSLKAIVLADGRKIALAPSPVMRCDMAESVGRWITEDVAPLVETGKRRISRVVSLDAYDCRGRNGQPSAKLSEHGKGNALDMSAVQFVDGSSLRFTDKTNDLNIATLMRTSTCARFATVLGPGSDGFHEDHVHLDLEARRHSGKICQWGLR